MTKHGKVVPGVTPSEVSGGAPKTVIKNGCAVRPGERAVDHEARLLRIMSVLDNTAPGE